MAVLHMPTLQGNMCPLSFFILMYKYKHCNHHWLLKMLTYLCLVCISYWDFIHVSHTMNYDDIQTLFPDIWVHKSHKILHEQRCLFSGIPTDSLSDHNGIFWTHLSSTQTCAQRLSIRVICCGWNSTQFYKALSGLIVLTVKCVT